MNKKLIAAARSSPLSLKQAEEVRKMLPDIDLEIMSVLTSGDIDKESSLMGSVSDDFFTDAVDELVLNGKADFAIHSAKDLPVSINPLLEVAALTEAFDTTDSFVSRGNIKLSDIPPGFRVGTSSLSRKESVERYNSNASIVSIRGTIEERLSLIEKGIVDGIIVAACAMKRLGLDSLITEILPFKTHHQQGSLAIIGLRSRKDLTAYFYHADKRVKYGRVYLIGAGCGSIDDMTLRAVSILNKASVIVYDDLINPSLLSNIRGEKIYAGKRAGKHSMKQEEINELLYSLAIEGKSIVRLKSGDPMVFGRAGEEIDYLTERFVECSVIPGVSSGFYGASSYQIPLTYRGKSKEIVLRTGHTGSHYDKSNTAKTFIYYMGGAFLENIQTELENENLNKNTPCVLIENAGSYKQSFKRCFLEELKNQTPQSPVVLIAGETAGLLKDKRKILYTGINPADSHIVGDIIHCPLIKVSPIFPKKLTHISLYNGVIFTSSYGVRFFYDFIGVFPEKIIAIGNETKKELSYFTDKYIETPEKADSFSLADLVKKYIDLNFIYPTSDISDNETAKLKNVDKYVIYKTDSILCDDLPDPDSIDGVYFSSPSTVDSFYENYKTFPEHLLYYTIGNITGNKFLSYFQDQKKDFLTVLPGFKDSRVYYFKNMRG